MMAPKDPFLLVLPFLCNFPLLECGQDLWHVSIEYGKSDEMSLLWIGYMKFWLPSCYQIPLLLDLMMQAGIVSLPVLKPTLQAAAGEQLARKWGHWSNSLQEIESHQKAHELGNIFFHIWTVQGDLNPSWSLDCSLVKDSWSQGSS